MNRAEKQRHLLIFNNLIHGDRTLVAKAFCLMAQKHYKGWHKMILEFYCQAMKDDNCSLCINKKECKESKWQK